MIRRASCRLREGSPASPRAIHDPARRLGALVASALVLLAAHALAADERSIQIAGAIEKYDPATVTLWPERLQLLTEGPGSLVAEAKRRAAAAGNPARFFFYLSLTSLDGGCGCFDADLLARLRREHPDFLLRGADGEPVSTFLGQLPPGRQLALDVGNPAYVDAWAQAALDELRRHDWDGVWADNVIRGRFDKSWSSVPVNARTRRPYTTPEYRRDLLAALRRVRERFRPAGKQLLGNHSAAWESFDEDPVLADQVLAMDGVEIEDFAHTFGGDPQPEADWLKQLRYLDFANRHGVFTWARGGKGSLMEPLKREYVLASYLLTRRGRSVVGDLNAAKTWWPALATDPGPATSDFYCLDPNAGFARATPCPAPARVFGRDFQRARVLVNPSDTARNVPLGGAHLRGLDGNPAPDPLPLGPHTGRVLRSG